MKVTTVLTPLINAAFRYVIDTSKHYNIDESHSMKHSMEVFSYANSIYKSELDKNPFLLEQQSLIYAAAIGHDMCDKKYMDESEGINKYKTYMEPFLNSNDLDTMGSIISTMSYSKVRVKGFPDLGEYQMAYHIVREADLLTAYDVDRSIIYKMYCNNWTYTDALKETLKLFETRMFTMRSDNLFITSYSKKESLKLHKKAQKQISNLKNLYT
jgi:hypothetical protein